MSKDPMHIAPKIMLLKMWSNQRDTALLHLMHDFGTAGEQFLVTHYNDKEQLIRGVLEQRAQMTLNNTLYSLGENGELTLSGKLDLANLGVAPEHIAHVEALKVQERAHIQKPMRSVPLKPKAQALARKGWLSLSPSLNSE